MIRLTATLTKKIPHPAHEYGSIGASLSIEVECLSSEDPIRSSQRLFQQIDLALEAELRRQSTPDSKVPSLGTTVAIQTAANPAPQITPSQPRHGRARPPAPVTASQLRLLERLFADHPDQRAAVMAQYRVSNLGALTVRQASEAIDVLKQAAR